MKYLKYRNDFLNLDFDSNIDILPQIKGSSLVREAFENDLRWGDSLIGRLINSTLRKFNIYRKRITISKLVGDFKRELDLLLEEALFSEQKREIELVKVKYLLKQIFGVVSGNQSDSEKIGVLIGEKPKYQGMVQQAIDEIERIDSKNLPEKEELLEKLKNFKQSLVDMNIDPEETVEEKPSEGKVSAPDQVIFDATRSILKSIIGMSDEIVKSSKKEPVVGKGLMKSERVNNFIDFLNETNLIEGPKERGISVVKPESKEVSAKTKDIQKSGPIYINDETDKPEEETIDAEYVEIKDPKVSKVTDVSSIIWKKIVMSFQKSGLIKMIPRIKELLEKSENSDMEKKWIVTIGKQLLVNQNTIGKNRLTYDQLIKEADQIPTSYNDIPKAISLLSNVILPISKNTDVVKKLGVYEDIINFIGGYSQLEKSKANESILIREEAENKEMGGVQKSWYQYFREGEEKNWKVDDAEIKSLIDQSKKSEGEKKNIDTKSEKGKKIIDDHIIKIVNIFGRAWDKYAVDEIPSGRENAKISQKTFREYVYVGKSGSRPKFDKDAGPGYGPWASKRSFKIWQDGVTKILEDGKYRKVLANINFVSKPEDETETTMGVPGSGITLFNFINDMLGYGEDFDFRSKRERIFKKYFNTDKKFGNEGGGNPKSIISSDDKGDLSRLIWGTHTDLYGKVTITMVKENGLRKFFKMDFVDKEGRSREIVCYPVDIYDDDRKKYIIVRFHTGSPKCTKESMISTYMKNISDDKIRDKKIPVNMEFDRSTKIYVGVLPIGFPTKSPLSFKYIDIKNLRENMEAKDLSDMDVKEIKGILYLKYLEERKDGTQESHIVTFGEDDLIDRGLKQKPTNDVDYKSIRQILKNEIKRGIFDVK